MGTKSATCFIIVEENIEALWRTDDRNDNNNNNSATISTPPTPLVELTSTLHAFHLFFIFKPNRPRISELPWRPRFWQGELCWKFKWKSFSYPITFVGLSPACTAQPYSLLPLLVLLNEVLIVVYVSKVTIRVFTSLADVRVCLLFRTKPFRFCPHGHRAS